MRIIQGKVRTLSSEPWTHSEPHVSLIKTSISFDDGVSLNILTRAEAPKIQLADHMVVAASGWSQPYDVKSFKNLSTGEDWFFGVTVLFMTGVTLAFCPWLFSVVVKSNLLVLKVFNYGFYAASLGCFYRLVDSYIGYQKIKRFKTLSSPTTVRSN